MQRKTIATLATKLLLLVQPCKCLVHRKITRKKKDKAEEISKREKQLSFTCFFLTWLKNIFRASYKIKREICNALNCFVRVIRENTPEKLFRRQIFLFFIISPLILYIYYYTLCALHRSPIMQLKQFVYCRIQFGRFQLTKTDSERETQLQHNVFSKKRHYEEKNGNVTGFIGNVS